MWPLIQMSPLCNSVREIDRWMEIESIPFFEWKEFEPPIVDCVEEQIALLTAG